MAGRKESSVGRRAVVVFDKGKKRMIESRKREEFGLPGRGGFLCLGQKEIWGR